MSNLPPGWEWSKLRDIARWSSGGTPKSNVSEYYDGDIPWVVTGDLTDSYVRATSRSITQLGLVESSAKLVPAGTVLVAMYGASIGRAGIAAMPLATNQAIASAQVNTRVADIKYVLYYLLSQRSALVAAGKGAAQPNIGQGILKEWPIPVAPLADQAEIVASIEEQFSCLDAGIAILVHAKKNLATMRYSVLDEAVEASRPAGSVDTPLDQLVASGRKISYGVLVPGENDPAGTPLVRVGDLINRQVKGNLKYIAPDIAARFPRTRLQGGEVLLSLVGTIGRTAVVSDELAGANVARALAVIPVEEKADPRYVAVALSRAKVTKDLVALSHEVARKTLNLEDVRRYSIPLPDHETQLAVVGKVEETETWISSIEETINKALRRADRLRSSVLSAAFSGRLI
jgi:type I restriction enzyme S subunit